MRPRPLPQIPALWEVCPAPPSVRKSHAPCQRSHASIPDATPNPGKPLLLASRGPAPLRRLLRPPSSEVGPRLRDLGLFLPLKLPWTSEIPSLLQPSPKVPPPRHAHCHSQLRLGSALWIPAAPPPAVNSPGLLSAAAPPLLAGVQPESELQLPTGKVECGPTWNLPPLPSAAVPGSPAGHSLMLSTSPAAQPLPFLPLIVVKMKIQTKAERSHSLRVCSQPGRKRTLWRRDV